MPDFPSPLWDKTSYINWKLPSPLIKPRHINTQQNVGVLHFVRKVSSSWKPYQQSNSLTSSQIYNKLLEVWAKINLGLAPTPNSPSCSLVQLPWSIFKSYPVTRNKKGDFAQLVETDILWFNLKPVTLEYTSPACDLTSDLWLYTSPRPEGSE